MQKAIKSLALLDWVLSGGTIIYGLVTWDYLILALGVVGLIVAWFKPAMRLQAYLQSKFIKKAKGVAETEAALAAEQFYDEVLGAREPATELAMPVTGAAFNQPMILGPTVLSNSRHNVLRREFLNLYGPVPSTPSSWR